jgi:glycosyltransferase involved in cell wall biosynthesis
LESIQQAFVVDGINSELIILGNHCTDSTNEIIKYWQSHLKFTELSNDKNYRGSLQYGQLVSLAEGDWIVSPGDDDIFISEGLSKLVRLCMYDELLGKTLISGEALTIAHLGRKLPKVFKPGKFMDSRMGLARTLFESPFWMPAIAFRRESIDLKDFAESLTTCDWWLWVNGLTKGEVFYLNEPLVSYRIHEGQEQKTYLNQMWELDKLRVFLSDLQGGSLHAWIRSAGDSRVSEFLNYLKHELKGRHLSVAELAIMAQLILEIRISGQLDDSKASELLILCGVDPRFANTWLKQTSQEEDFNLAIAVAESLRSSISFRVAVGTLSGEKRLNYYLGQIRNSEIQNSISPVERKIVTAYRRVKKIKLIRKVFKK